MEKREKTYANVGYSVSSFGPSETRFKFQIRFAISSAKNTEIKLLVFFLQTSTKYESH